MKSLRLLGATLAVVVLTILGSSVASAHEGKGVITVQDVQDQPGGTEYTVRVTWENDGHPAADATVTATAIDSGGTQQTPITMAKSDAEGHYKAFVPFPTPGSWTVRFSVVTPTGTADVTRDVAAPSTTLASTTTSASVETSAVATDPDGGSGNGGGAKAVLGGGLLVLIVAGAAIGFRRSSKRHDP